MTQNRSHAVMAQRREPPDSLDFFPTPPWSTRALFEHVLPGALDGAHICSAWDPACGEGHMAAVAEEYVAIVKASDVFDYGYGEVADFLDPGTRVAPWPDLLVCNPPFKLAEEFARRGLDRAGVAVALLVRSVWLEGSTRFNGLFRPFPPAVIAQFVERVPMTKGRWDPQASTATAYSWILWRVGLVTAPRFMWIPPGQRKALTRPDDARRFAVRPSAPLLDPPRAHSPELAGGAA